MAAIHPKSRICTLPQFDIFTVPPTQYSVEKDLQTQHLPLSSITSNTPLMYQVVSGDDEYIMLSESKLHMRLKIKLKKVSTAATDKGTEKTLAATDWSNIKPANYLLQSLWKQIEINYNSKELTHSPPTYAYRSFFEALIGFSNTAKEGYLQGAWWSNATNGQSIPTECISADFKTAEIDLIGRLHTDLTWQQKAILGRAVIDFKLVPNAPEFYLNITNGTAVKYEVEIEFVNPTLHIHRAKVTPMLMSGHMQGFKAASTAKYPITRTEVKSIIIPRDTQNFPSADYICNGQLPRRMLFSLVDLTAFNGDFGKDPYDFEHCNINYIIANIDGVQYPNVPFKPDFSKKLVAREFDHLYTILNQDINDPVLKISKDKFISNPIFGFNFNPDLSSGCGALGHVNLIKRGSLRLTLNFSSPLTATKVLLVFLEFDNLIEIDEQRNVFSDYN